MHRDDVVEAAQFAGKSIRTSKRLNVKCRQMIDMGRLSLAKQGLQNRIRENARVKNLNELPNRLFPAGMLEKGTIPELVGSG
jgi:hypothetical protein